MLTNLDEIKRLRDRGALFAINHSGGKDSQAMYLLVSAYVPADQIMVVHAPLPGAEWEGVIEHINSTISQELVLAQAFVGRGPDKGKLKTFESMVLGRGYFPTPKHRQCTSDLKRGPLEREIRRYIKRTAPFNDRKLVVSCMGMRAQESSSRSKLTTLMLNKTNSKAGRTWYDWLPIHTMLVEEVFEAISDHGQQPHWAYGVGMSRLSCCFCIMANKSDMRTAAKHNPGMYARYVALERHLDQTFTMPSSTYGRRFLPEVTGVAVDEALVAKHLIALGD
jgi:3'-phosphoadenosine 5'-phosphosulfate sulfotransferase (PAPS reductase)/FAD synthetase